MSAGTGHHQVVFRASLALASVVALWSPPLFAHVAQTSSVVLDIDDHAVTADTQLPLDPLRMAVDGLPDDAATLLPAHEAELRRYAEDHLRLDDAARGPFAMTVDAMRVARVDDADVLQIHVTFTAPEGAPMRALALRDDLILHRVATHRILVSVRHDFGQAQLGSEPQLVGVAMHSERTVTLHREAHSALRGFRALFDLGVRHIAEGTDHLLFLLVLLLPAPLTALLGRWAGVRAPRAALRSIAGVVTAFTLGHSISLATATLGVVTVTSAVVELLIAVSIAVTAVHALRPIFPRREAWVALAFGVVHGFAFAEALRELGLRGASLAWSLLGFNLGIEAMQLGVVAVTVPWLVLLAATPLYPRVRIAGAVFGAVAAAGWVAERLTGRGNVIARAVAATARHPTLLLVALAATAIGARAALAKRRPTA